MAKSKHAEIVVIGAGPGGYAAAFRAADLGKQVILVDKDPTLGGVCLNRGCIPSKALLHLSKVMEEASHLSKMGITYGEPQIDLDAIRAHKDKIVLQLNEGIAQMAKARKVEWVKGAATFTSNTELRVKTDVGDMAISFNKCIVAAGSVSATIPGRSSRPPICSHIQNSVGFGGYSKKTFSYWWRHHWVGIGPSLCGTWFKGICG